VPPGDRSAAVESAGPRDWRAEYVALSEADRITDASGAPPGLSPEDLERLAVAAYLTGHDDEVGALRERAHHLYLDRGQVEQAVRCGWWLGFHLQNAGDAAQAAGWLARLRRLVGDDADEVLTCLLSLPDAVAAMFGGDAASALPVMEQAAHVAVAHGDTDLFVVAGMGRGRCLEMLGRSAESAAVLDEIMVHVAGGRCAPQLTGLAYCVVIALCMEHFDLARAQEWTEALGRWIDEQPGIVPYRGVCMVHRAEILQMRGAWTRAAEEADLACGWLARSGEAAIGAAHYRVGELARLRGQVDLAEEAYRRATGYGVEVQPGLARLRLRQNRLGAAVAGLDRALAEHPRVSSRAPMLAARVELGVAAGDLAAARVALDGLTGLAETSGAPYLRALADHCAGVVLLAGDDARAALPLLRHAARLWQKVDAPYEAALTRAELGRACQALGDADAARMELQAARSVLTELGATADLAALDAATGPPGHPLSPREVEVLRLIATGATNRMIADRLVLSEKTVARHVSNIFAKLEIGSRSAATAYAYEHHLA
jgi:DNA-binding NarL/FixJ family response regulator